MITAIIVASIVVFLLVLIGVSYVKAPPDTAFIISGLKRKTVVGKAALRIPFLQRIDKLLLRLISIDVKTSSAVPTADYINIMVDSVVNVKVPNSEEMISIAAQNFLNQDEDYIAKVAREVLEGNMREIVGQMKLKDMVSDRQKFAELVKKNAEPDLAAMGLEVISFNVQNFIDRNGVIENLGVDNIAQISKNAAIAKALAEKEVAVAQAEAKKESNDARVIAQTEIDKAIGAGYNGVNKIVMLGGDSSKLAENILSTTTQVQEGLSASMGIDLKSLLAGFLGGKLGAGNNGVTVNVEPTEE